MGNRVAIVRVPGAGSVRIRPGDTLMLGRHRECDLHINDGSVSRRHAKLVWPKHDGVPWIIDLGSSNGTFLNGEKVAGQIEVHDGAVLRIGKVKVEFHLTTEDSPMVPYASDAPKLVGWLSSPGAFEGLLRSLEVDRESGLLVLGQEEDNHTISLQHGRMVGACRGELRGSEALTLLLEQTKPGTYYRLLEVPDVPRDDLNLWPSDIFREGTDSTTRL